MKAPRLLAVIRTGIVSAIVAVTLLAGVPAMADPPPSHNPNTSVWTFDCSRGSETRTFQAIAILQSASIAGQRLDGTGVVIFMHVEVNGQVVYDIPGQAGRSDLWSCTIAELPGVVADMLLTPRH
jgi:hypothetical protein